MIEVIEYLGGTNPLVQLILQTKPVDSGGEFSLSAVFGQLGDETAPETYTGAAFVMEFASDASQEDTDYWHAEFCIGEIQEPDDPLIIYITDVNGNPIKGGVFTFLGFPYQIGSDGIVESSLHHFRDNLTNTEISLRFAMSGRCVPGHFSW